jgi:protein kinase-like protein
MGTAGFLSPEQLAGGRATPASDIYALGAVLFFATTQKLVFPGASTAQINERTRSSEEPDLREVPSALQSIVADCLTKQPNLRPTPRQVVERLARIRRQLPSEERRPNHRSAQLRPTKVEMVFPDARKAVGLAELKDLRPYARSWLSAGNLQSFLQVPKRAGLIVRHAPLASRTLVAAMVIWAVPGYSLLHGVHGWGGILLAAALFVTIIIALTIELAGILRIALGLILSGPFLWGLCAFILTIANVQARWWNRIPPALTVGLVVGLVIFLGAVFLITSVAEETKSVAIGIGWGMLLAPMVTTLLYWAADAGLGISVGLGLMTLLIGSTTIAVLLHTED